MYFFSRICQCINWTKCTACGDHMVRFTREAWRGTISWKHTATETLAQTTSKSRFIPRGTFREYDVLRCRVLASICKWFSKGFAILKFPLKHFNSYLINSHKRGTQTFGRIFNNKTCFLVNCDRAPLLSVVAWWVVLQFEWDLPSST